MTQYKMTETTVRRGLYGMLAGGLLSGIASAAIAMPTANAEPTEPAGPTADSCSVSGMATTQSSVSALMSTYLQSHPETNKDLSDIAKQPVSEATQSYRAYFAENEQVADELRDIQQPVTELASQCGTQVTPNLVTDALKTA
jgi:hemophore-related protein